MTPNSGPYTGTTDILISGKGFVEELAPQAKCRFGIPSDYKIVDAVWQSYYSMICRSPFDFQ
jgi:IPT/TIG domain